jgi:hypothetical protein
MKTKLYIAGPITNEDPTLQKLNIVRFFEVEKELQKKDYPFIFNPCREEMLLDLQTYDECMSNDLIYIIKEEPEMFFLLGWEKSKGASLEHVVAKQLGLTITYEVHDSFVPSNRADSAMRE